MLLMSIPDYVPSSSQKNIRAVEIINASRHSLAQRPAIIKGSQPRGNAMGSIGPDQGYAIKLATGFTERLLLGNLDLDDVIAGGVALAMKRASLFGRAPIIYDLEVAFKIYGFTNPDASADLIDKRESLFPEVHNSHHYLELRQIVDIVSADFIKRPHSEIYSDCDANWRSPFND